MKREPHHKYHYAEISRLRRALGGTRVRMLVWTVLMLMAMGFVFFSLSGPQRQELPEPVDPVKQTAPTGTWVPRRT
jgi:hypothetical protein